MTNKNTLPLVTIAMVTYNSEKYVKIAIDSVLASDYINFELIIFDDCSSDCTWEIIQSYEDSRIRKFRNLKNKGEYPNRNECINLALGEYFIFIDGDDYIYPHGLQHFVNGSLLNSDAAMIISRPESDHMIYPVCLTPDQVFKYDYLGNGLTSQGFPSTMFKTSCLKTEKLSISYIAGDGHIKKTLAYKHQTILIHCGVAWWRRTPGQASEKLFKTVEGVIESHNVNSLFLNKYKLQYLSKAETQQAEKRLMKPIFRKLIKLILAFRFNECLILFKKTAVDLRLFKSVFYKHKQLYQVANSVNPLNSIYD